MSKQNSYAEKSVGNYTRATTNVVKAIREIVPNQHRASTNEAINDVLNNGRSYPTRLKELVYILLDGVVWGNWPKATDKALEQFEQHGERGGLNEPRDQFDKFNQKLKMEEGERDA